MMENTLTFGAAKEIITPCIPMTMIGFGSVYGAPFEGIHDDLYARTLLMTDAEGHTVILVALDMLFHEDSLTDALRAYVRKTYGVPEENLHVTYTHTHYGPAVRGYDFIHWKQEYEDFLLERITRCIDRAYLGRISGTVAYGSAHGMWNISRRLPRENGTDFLPNPSGDRDDGLYFLKFCDEQGNIRALAMNFACHPSNLNAYRTLSGEYPARLCQLMEARHYGCTALFFQGPGSDTKLRIGAKSDRFSGIDFAECDEVARSMAERIDGELFAGRTRVIPVSLCACAFKLRLPLEVYPRSYYEDEIRRLTGGELRPFDKDDPTVRPASKLFWACNTWVLEHYDELPDYVPLNCGVVALNPDFYILSMGGEPACDIKRVLQETLTDKTLLFFGYNDAIAYVPSDKLIAEGGYEAGERSIPEYRLKGQILPGVDVLYREAFTKAIAELMR